MSCIRRSSAYLATAALTLYLVMPSVANAATVSELKQQLETLKTRSKKAGDAYSKAYWELDETEVALAKTEKEITQTEEELAVAQERLGARVDGIYRRQNIDIINVLLEADSFEAFVTRADYLARIGEADAEVIAEVKELREDLLAKKRNLVAQQATKEKRAKQLRAKRDQLQKDLKLAEADFNRVKTQLDNARSPGGSSGGMSRPGPNGMVFPVRGSYYYSNTWGASRSGGRRRHQGTDIMAPHGTPVVAVTNGTVTSKEGGLGGKTIWLRGTGGWTFYYAHLNGWAVRSGQVRAGQVIGYVGSTGNATANAPHLHFQMHPGGGAPVNPYPYLRAME